MKPLLTWPEQRRSASGRIPKMGRFLEGNMPILLGKNKKIKAQNLLFFTRGKIPHIQPSQHMHVCTQNLPEPITQPPTTTQPWHFFLPPLENHLPHRLHLCPDRRRNRVRCASGRRPAFRCRRPADCRISGPILGPDLLRRVPGLLPHPKTSSPASSLGARSTLQPRALRQRPSSTVLSRRLADCRVSGPSNDPDPRWRVPGPLPPPKPLPRPLFRRPD